MLRIVVFGALALPALFLAMPECAYAVAVDINITGADARQIADARLVLVNASGGADPGHKQDDRAGAFFWNDKPRGVYTLRALDGQGNKVGETLITLPEPGPVRGTFDLVTQSFRPESRIDSAKPGRPATSVSIGPIFSIVNNKFMPTALSTSASQNVTDTAVGLGLRFRTAWTVHEGTRIGVGAAMRLPSGNTFTSNGTLTAQPGFFIYQGVPHTTLGNLNTTAKWYDDHPGFDIDFDVQELFGALTLWQDAGIWGEERHQSIEITSQGSLVNSLTLKQKMGHPFVGIGLTAPLTPDFHLDFGVRYAFSGSTYNFSGADAFASAQSKPGPTWSFELSLQYVF